MTLKLFISYAHEDEVFKNAFVVHLALLKRDGIISEWVDKKILPGAIIDEEIKKHLNDSDLIAFLISPDFLNSNYCCDVEVAQSLERMKNGALKIIPIPVRISDWLNSPLKQYMAATKDAKPIKKYEDPDEAWVEVVTKIRTMTQSEEFISIKTAVKKIENNNIPTLKEDFKNFINNTELVFSHPRKELLNLNDIFIYPDLKNLQKGIEEVDVITSAEKFLIKIDLKKNIIIMADEQGGKTSLLKMLYQGFLKAEYTPIFIEGESLNTANVNELINKQIKIQYSNLEDANQVILIIDDFEKSSLNWKYKLNFLDEAKKSCRNIIFTSDSSLKFEEDKILKLSDFEHYEILDFGNLKRSEIIEKWNSLGREETIETRDLQSENDRITQHVDAIIRKDLLPRKPVYILTIIQLLESSKPSDFSLTAYGYCYQSLLQASLLRVGLKYNEFDPYLNFLTELAFHLFKSKNDTLTFGEFEIFSNSYSDTYLNPVKNKYSDILFRANILQKSATGIKFGYKYIFYFYTSKYISENLESANIKKILSDLCENLHTEKNANILIFLVHHSKNPIVIDEILLHAMTIFDERPAATLVREQTQYLIDFFGTIPKLVLENKDSINERKKDLIKKDNFEKISSEEIHDENTILKQINKSARLIDVIGQILINRHGSLKINQLIELTTSAISSGLKFLNFFLEATHANKDLLLQIVSKLLKGNESLTDQQLTNETNKIFLMMCYGVTYSVIKKISTSIGSNKLLPIFDQIKSTPIGGTPAMQLIFASIKLDVSKEVNASELKALNADFETNPIAQRLLQEVIVQYLNLNDVGYKDRQRIAEILKITMPTQRSLQSNKELKK